MMTSATKDFYICSFPFSAQIMLHQDVCTFVFFAFKLCSIILMQSWTWVIFRIFVAFGNQFFIGFVMYRIGGLQGDCSKTTFHR